MSNNQFHGCLALPSAFNNANQTTCDVQSNNFCCSKHAYYCFGEGMHSRIKKKNTNTAFVNLESCQIQDTLSISSGTRVQYNYNSFSRSMYRLIWLLFMLTLLLLIRHYCS